MRLMWNTRCTSARPSSFSLLLGLEHAFQGRLQVVGDLVDDVVAADLHAQLLGQGARAFVGHDGKADDHRVGGVGQVDVGLADSADGRLQDLDLHFGMLQLFEFLADGLDRTAHIGPQNHVERLHRAFFAQRS